MPVGRGGKRVYLRDLRAGGGRERQEQPRQWGLGGGWAAKVAGPARPQSVRGLLIQSAMPKARSARRSWIPADLFSPADINESRPFRAADLRRTEDVLGVRLPTAFVQLLQFRNGGYLYRRTIKSAQRPPRYWGPASVYEIESIAGLASTNVMSSLQELFISARHEGDDGWDLPAGLVPFTGDGHFHVCLDYRTCGPRGNPSVVHTITSDYPGKMPKEFRVAESFEAMIRGLQPPKAGAGSAYIALDSPRVRGEKLAEIMRRIGCKRHRFSGSKKRPDNRVAWVWRKHESNAPDFYSGALLLIESNNDKMNWTRFASRPAKHPILRIETPHAARSACVIELLIGLGEGATLLAIDSPGWEVPQA